MPGGAVRRLRRRWVAHLFTIAGCSRELAREVPAALLGAAALVRGVVRKTEGPAQKATTPRTAATAPSDTHQTAPLARGPRQGQGPRSGPRSGLGRGLRQGPRQGLRSGPRSGLGASPMGLAREPCQGPASPRWQWGLCVLPLMLLGLAMAPCAVTCGRCWGSMVDVWQTSWQTCSSPENSHGLLADVASDLRI